MQMNNLQTALEAREKGIVALPCRPGTKIPAVRWKPWQTSLPPLELQRDWFSKAGNIAIVTNGMVVFDCEDPALAELVIERCGDTPHKLKSPGGGIHLGYRRRRGIELANRVKIKGMDIDIRTDGGVELIPHSETERGCYEWIGPGLCPYPNFQLRRSAGPARPRDARGFRPSSRWNRIQTGESAGPGLTSSRFIPSPVNVVMTPAFGPCANVATSACRPRKH
jgi:hypothetical protein